MLATESAEHLTHNLRFDIFPAIHLRDGQSIDFTGSSPEEAAIVESWQPLETARFWIEEGADWIHIVDIDAMFQRDATLNWKIITELCQLPVKIQLAGGHVSRQDIERALQIGVNRILLDASQPDINRLATEAVALHGPESLGAIFTTAAVDQVGAIEKVSDWPEDWQAAGGEQAVTQALQLYHLGITTGVHTTIAKDGTMRGCDVRITQELASLSGMNFLVGGEVYDMDDVVHCYNRKRVTGIIVGRALYNGTINLQQALNKTRRKIAFETGLPGWKQEQSSLKARLRYAIAISFLEHHLPDKAQRILDAGGGNGLDALSLASLGHRVDLLDESMAMIADYEQASEFHPAADQITTHNCNIRDIPRRFDNEQFDAVICHNVIQYVSDWQATLRTLLKPLRTGGLFSLITRNLHALPYQADIDAIEPDKLPELFSVPSGVSAVFDAQITLFTPEELMRWMHDHHLESVQQYGILSLHHYANLTDQAENLTLMNKLEGVEKHLGKHSPHRDVARYIQLIGIKQA